MFKFFNYGVEKGTPRLLSNFDYVKRTIKWNTETLIKYWREMNWVVKSEHILVNLFNSLHAEASDVLESYRLTRDQVTMQVPSRGIITSINYGRLQPKSNFYGNECREIIIEVPFDDAVEQMMTRSYKEWEPIKVIHHPFTSFDYQLPNNKLRRSGEKGLVIIKMDLSLLYTQYRMWLRDKATSTYGEEGVRKSVMNFLHSFPITNMMRSHIDVVWFNRLFALQEGAPVSNLREDDRLRLATSYTGTDEVLTKYIEIIERGRYDFQEICGMLPGIYTKSLKERMNFDGVRMTHQIRLAVELFRSETMVFLFRSELINPTGRNTMYINEYKQYRRKYDNSNLNDTIKGLNVYRPMKEYIQERIIPLVSAIS